MAVEKIVDVFSLEVLTCEDALDREVVKSTSRRPGLEFMGYLDYLPMVEHMFKSFQLKSTKPVSRINKRMRTIFLKYNYDISK